MNRRGFLGALAAIPLAATQPTIAKPAMQFSRRPLPKAGWVPIITPLPEVKWREVDEAHPHPVETDNITWANDITWVEVP